MIVMPMSMHGGSAGASGAAGSGSGNNGANSGSNGGGAGGNGGASGMSAGNSGSGDWQQPPAVLILERSLNRMRGGEVSLSAFAHLFSGLVIYLQRGVKGIKDLEAKLSSVGYQVGLRMHELLAIRDNKTLKRENRLINLLIQINQKAWKFMFGKAADSLLKSSDNEDEYMINDDDLMVNKFISVPREISQFNAGAFVAGIVEAMLDASGFVT